jgi:membrane associated rhomboid family serine protease
VVFPLYDHNPLDEPRLPWVTWGLIAVNVVLFLTVQGSADQNALFARFGAVPDHIAHPLANGWAAEVGLITGMFVHDGWAHIFGNMIYLWVFGDDIEEALGPWRFIAFYFLAGIAAGLAFIVGSPGSTIPLVGASGAIAGVLAAYLMLRPCAKVTVFVLRAVIRVRAFWVIGGWGILQLLSLAGQANDGVAYLAHIGGFGAGAALFCALRPTGVRLFECMTADAPPAPATLT